MTGISMNFTPTTGPFRQYNVALHFQIQENNREHVFRIDCNATEIVDVD